MVASNNDMSNQNERRGYDRIGIHRSVRLSLDDGTRVDGDTADVSLSGVKIATKEPVSAINGQAAVLQIYLGKKRLSPEYGGTIIRNEDNSVCMTLNSDRRTSFSIFLTRDLFKLKNASYY